MIPPRTLEHQAGFFKIAIALIREAQEKHNIEDIIVSVERTGNLHLIPKRAFAKAGFEVRVIHPFATKQYRMPADPGNKTDETDLYAQHRAAVAGFGLCELELESPYRELQLRGRHRRNLIEKSSSIACQIKEHMHLSLPGYTTLFDHLFEHQAAMAIARSCDSPARVLELGHEGLKKLLRGQAIRYQVRTVDKILAWAAQAAVDSIQYCSLHHAIWTDLEDVYQHFRQRVFEVGAGAGLRPGEDTLCSAVGPAGNQRGISSRACGRTGADPSIRECQRDYRSGWPVSVAVAK